MEIDPEFSIARDDFRKKNSGRGVGEGVINSYAKKMDGAFRTYQSEIKKPDGYVDRIIHFKWTGGAVPSSGDYRLVSDQRRKPAKG